MSQEFNAIWASPLRTYPAGLQPDSTSLLELDRDNVEVPTAHLTFPRGDKDLFVDTFGGKGVVNHKGRPMFAELALREICADAGWQARWLQTYGAPKMRPKLYAGWDPQLHRQSQNSDWFEQGSPIHELLIDLASERGSYTGCPDVVAWTDDSVLFVESKLQGKDKIRQTQKDWLSTALRHGLTLDRYVIAEWSVIS